MKFINVVYALIGCLGMMLIIFGVMLAIKRPDDKSSGIVKLFGFEVSGSNSLIWSIIGVVIVVLSASKLDYSPAQPNQGASTIPDTLKNESVGPRIEKDSPFNKKENRDGPSSKELEESSGEVDKPFIEEVSKNQEKLNSVRTEFSTVDYSSLVNSSSKQRPEGKIDMMPQAATRTLYSFLNSNPKAFSYDDHFTLLEGNSVLRIDKSGPDPAYQDYNLTDYKGSYKAYDHVFISSDKRVILINIQKVVVLTEKSATIYE